ncbi:MAG: hypothetical protein CVU13_07385 [Bacteroidetes bacterium HGW-Bacteroidetes-8]|jgi:thiol-disulfide isomerase/thioredoxin|nr:MAG: hypothetical protein CVU13_07385 [Bacteroidetes bacterium HGW-Bacteroidetes-8]
MRVIVTIVLLFIHVAISAQSGVARIHGVMKSGESGYVSIDYDGAASLIGKSREIFVSKDKNGVFDTIIPLEKPVYLRIRRNTIYLSPGDNLECEIYEDSNNSLFRGKGSEANNYLCARLFPKAGSYLVGGRNIQNTIDETIEYIKLSAQKSRERLNSLQNISPEFRKMENARISADVAISYIMIYNYSGSLKPFESPEKKSEALSSYRESISKDVKTLIGEVNRDEFIDIDAVRALLLILMNSYAKYSEGIELTPLFKEYQKAIEVKNLLANNATHESIKRVTEMFDSISNPDCRREINFLLAKSGSILPGSPAYDIELTDLKLNKLKLSDFKGKYLFIDFWATWCMPCLRETPYFEALANKLSEKDIVFISICTDKEIKPWLDHIIAEKKSVIQLYSNDKALITQWNLSAIPRFLFIDKEFRIITANAPWPSNKTTEEYLTSIVK